MATIGDPLTFPVLFTNASGTASDPTTVRFFLLEGVDGTELEWTYDASPVSGTHYPVGANPITKSATGTYSLVWVSRKPERHTGFWLGSGTTFQSQQDAQFVRHSEVGAVGIY
jgi:hypothetical protein